jgi:predicted permease
VRPLKIRRQISALVAKDLKLITRNPAFFGIFGFPIVYALLYAYQMPKSLAVILGVFVMIQTFCGLAAFISLSVDRSLYTSILPVTQLKVAVSKVIISICVYIFSSTILAISMFLRAMPFYLPVLLLPSAISVVLFVLILAPQHSSGNLYSGLHFLFLILIPSAIISTIPVLTGYFGMLLGFRFEAPTLISALMEMFAMIAVFNIRFRS